MSDKKMLDDNWNMLCPNCQDSWTHIDQVHVVPNTYNRQKEFIVEQEGENKPVAIKNVGGAGMSEDCKVTIEMYCESCGAFDMEFIHHEGNTKIRWAE